MNRSVNERFVLAARPKGRPEPANFRFETADIATPGENEVLLQVLYLSLDPYMRGRMSTAKSYADPVEINDVMVGGTVARIVESRHPDFAAGDTVLSYSGWQRYAVSQGKDLVKLDPDIAPVTTALGVLGMPGLTAYSGLLTIGRPKPGETVAVAAATGPVGSAVGQIARIKGARAVGIAGGPEKCAFLKNAFGFDAVADHRAEDFETQLEAACPNGIDVYYENVGGHVWSAVLPLLNTHARIPVCGLVGQYNATEFPGPDRLPAFMRQVLTRSLQIRGFIVSEFADQRNAFLTDMAGWISAGKLAYKEDIVDGLENAPDAFVGLLEGRNFGKLIIRVSE